MIIFMCRRNIKIFCLMITDLTFKSALELEDVLVSDTDGQ